MPDHALHRFEHEAMATTFEVIVAGQDAGYARSAAAMVFSEIDRLDALLNRHGPCSDVARINALQPGETVRLGADVLECLLLAGKAWADTDGFFDVTTGALIDCWRDARGNLREPDPQELAAARRRVGMQRLLLNPADFTVGLAPDTPGAVTVDLGGIAKGYALDKVDEILGDWDIGNALVHGGTSTALAIGDERPEEMAKGHQRGWRVGVGGRWGNAARLESLVLHNAALSGSGPELKREHILSPISGRPDRRHEAAWARCPSATLADALSTAFLLMTEERIRACCNAHPEVEAFVVPRDSNRGLVSIRGN
jgi:FAD:protein FMN transferase